MFSKVVILCATLVAVNAGALLHGAALAHTGSSISSRHQDAFGNYAFGYDIVDGHASSKSRSEVGDAHGNKKGSYSSNINHVAPVAPLAVAHAAPLAVAHAAPLAVAHAAPLAVAHAAPLALAHHAPLAVAHAAPLAVAHAAPLAVAHHAPLALAHAAPVAYSTSSAVNHVAAAPLVAGHGLIGAGHLAYGHGIAGPGLLSHRLGGIAYGGLKSIHY